MPGHLGRRAPTDWKHVDKYPLSAPRLAEITTPRPIVIGVNWYSNFDTPVKDSDGHYWIGKGDLGTIRGGHCVSLKQKGSTRRPAPSGTAWRFYDQGSEGACVGFGSSQMMTQFNDKLYFGRWLWDRAKEADEWSDTNPGDDNGSSVSAAFDVLRTKGHVTWQDSYADMNRDGEAGDSYPRSGLHGDPSEGISANRWITSVDDALQVLGYTGLDYVDVMNNWGPFYPQLVRMPATTFERLWKEEGEIGVPTDR